MIPQEATPSRELRVLARVMGQEQAWGGGLSPGPYLTCSQVLVAK